MNPRANIKGLLAGLSAVGCVVRPTVLSSELRPPPVVVTDVAQREDGSGGKGATPTDAQSNAQTGGRANVQAAGTAGTSAVSLPKTLTVPSCRNNFGENNAWKTIVRAVVAVEHPKKRYAQDVWPLVHEAEEQVKLLVTQGALSDAEGELFRDAINVRYSDLPSKPPPPGVPPPSCYAPQLPPEYEAAHRIAWRVPILEQLAAAQTLHPAVLCRILGALATDLNRAKNIRQRLLDQLANGKSGEDPEGTKLRKQLNRSIELLQQLLQRLEKLDPKLANH